MMHLCWSLNVSTQSARAYEAGVLAAKISAIEVTRDHFQSPGNDYVFYVATPLRLWAPILMQGLN